MDLCKKVGPFLLNGSGYLLTGSEIVKGCRLCLPSYLSSSDLFFLVVFLVFEVLFFQIRNFGILVFISLLVVVMLTNIIVFWNLPSPGRENVSTQLSEGFGHLEK